MYTCGGNERRTTGDLTQSKLTGTFDLSISAPGREAVHETDSCNLAVVIK